MSKYEIIVDQEECIGCGVCVQICNNFKLTDGKSYPINTEPEEIGCNQEAADSCPVDAIIVKKR
jgi:ferredoxin